MQVAADGEGERGPPPPPCTHQGGFLPRSPRDQPDPPNWGGGEEL